MASQADISRLVSQLRVRILPKHRTLTNPQGSAGRCKKLGEIVTGLLKYERIELNYTKADEARGYAERLISEAIRHGDCHTPTMQMADFWIKEKQVIHKLFKVLVPRYQNCSLSYTKLYRAPKVYSTLHPLPRSVLELRGNPFPPLVPDLSHNRNLIHNVLLDEAKKEYRSRKYAEMTEKLSATELEADTDKADSEAKSDAEPTDIESCSAIEGSASPGESTESVLKPTKPDSSN